MENTALSAAAAAFELAKQEFADFCRRVPLKDGTYTRLYEARDRRLIEYRRLEWELKAAAAR